jgi:hypothetical protein
MATTSGNDPATPQSWNRYSYAGGDPLNRADPGGTNYVLVGSGWCWGGGENGGAYLCDVYGWNGLIGWAQATAGQDGVVGGIGNIQSFPVARTSLESLLAGFAGYFSEMSSDNSPLQSPCEGDLAAAGVTPDEVAEEAGETQILNGMSAFQAGSQAGLYANTPLFGAEQAQVGDESIAQFMSLNPGVVAESQLGGTSIYINASYVNGYGIGQQEGLLLHEMLHNMTGLVDGSLQALLGLTVGAPSVNISNKLQQDCFN